MYFFMQPWVIYVQEENPTENIFSILRSFHNLHQFGCRTTKLLSQKRRHLAVFSISFLWQRGTRPEKKKSLLSKYKPSRVVLCIDWTASCYDFVRIRIWFSFLIEKYIVSPQNNVPIYHPGRHEKDLIKYLPFKTSPLYNNWIGTKSSQGWSSSW